MKATVILSQTPLTRVLTVVERTTGRTIYQTLDDCHGLDRCRDWATHMGVTLAHGYVTEYKFSA